MHLVQEIVDYIIDFLHDDQTTLTQVSLVSRAWVSRTRVHLCETMKITNDKFQTLSLPYLTPLCRYVNTLHLTWPSDIANLSTLLDCFEQSELHTLVIDSWELNNLGRQSIRRCFVKFPRLLVTTLELLDAHLASTNPLILLLLFPNVDNLAISTSSLWKNSKDEDEIAQATSLPRFRGSFRFFDTPSSPWCYQRHMLHTIAASPLQFQTVSFVVRSQSWEDCLDLLNSCSRTAREVSVVFSAPNPDLPVTNRPPINFTNLAKLRIMIHDAGDLVSQDGYNVHSLLNLIISPCLQQVVVRTLNESVPETVGWALLDESLANLVERCRAYENLTPLVVMERYPKIRGLLPRIDQLGILEVS